MFRNFAFGSKRPSVRAILLVLGGAVFLVAILIGQSVLEGRRQIEFYQALQRSIETPDTARLLVATLQDAVTAQRGFLLTGQQHFLNRYEQATRELANPLRALKAGLEGTPLKRELHEVEELVPAATKAAGPSNHNLSAEWADRRWKICCGRRREDGGRRGSCRYRKNPVR